LKDIIATLGTKDFWRLRIGVDRPTDQAQVADYVLHPFKKEEKNLIDDKMNDIETSITTFLSS
jgi:PTH1 family peptidyl-tRNA hydrolase